MIRIMYKENGKQKDVTGKVIVGHAQVIELEENNMEDRNKTVAELIADLQNKLNRANNRIEGLVKENDELKERNNKLKNENEYLEKEITRWHSKYTFEVKYAKL